MKQSGGRWKFGGKRTKFQFLFLNYSLLFPFCYNFSMKRLTLIFIMLVSIVMFSSPSYSNWTKVLENSGNIFYVDYNRIRKHDGFVYFWVMTDYLKPNYLGNFSSKVYKEGDCKLFRLKYLSDIYYTGQSGTGEVNSRSNKPDKEWTYPAPNTVNEYILKSVCSR